MVILFEPSQTCQFQWFFLEMPNVTYMPQRAYMPPPATYLRMSMEIHVRVSVKNTRDGDIHDICHFFTQPQFEAEKSYTWKCVNLRHIILKVVSRKKQLLAKFYIAHNSVFPFQLENFTLDVSHIQLLWWLSSMDGGSMVAPHAKHYLHCLHCLYYSNCFWLDGVVVADTLVF